MAQTEKELIIESIKEIIKEHGSFTTADLQAESSPIIKSIGKNIVQLAERFNLNGVEAISYVHDNEVDKEDITYEDLEENVLEDILLLAQNWEADELKTEKRIKTNG